MENAIVSSTNDVNLCPRRFLTIGLSPDSSHVVAGSATGIAILSLPELSVDKEMRTQHIVKNIIYSPDQRYVIVGAGMLSISGRVAVLNSSDFTEVNNTEMGYEVESIALSPDGKRVVAVGAKDAEAVLGNITILSLPDLFIVKHIQTQYHMRDVAFSPDGKHIAVVGGVAVNITILDSLDLSTLREVKTEHYVSKISYSPDGKYIIVVGGVIGAGGFVTVLDSSNFSKIKEIRKEYELDNATFSPDGKQILICGSVCSGSSGNVIVLDPSDFSIVREISTRCSISDARYTNDGRYVVMAGSDSCGVTLLDARSLQVDRDEAVIKQAIDRLAEMLKKGDEDFCEGILAFRELSIAPDKVIRVLEEDDTLSNGWKRVIINCMEKGEEEKRVKGRYDTRFEKSSHGHAMS